MWCYSYINFFFIIIFYSLHCPLSRPDLTYISLLIIPCIIYHVTNKETLNLEPFKDLCVDESLMKCKGRLAFSQYIPTKRSRFGVKFFVLCDVLTGYVQDMVIYTGSTTDICHYEGLGISGSVVMTLLAPYLGKGRVLYVDNWYSSPSLFQHLLYHGTGACGTVRANRKGMPVFTGKMVKGQVECRQNRTQLVVKWHDKRDVLMLTTVHSMMSATGKVDHVTGERKVKPHCVLEYNKKMGAVDRADMVKGFLECARKTRKWYKKIFFYLLDTAVLNSHIVHRQLSGKKFTQPSKITITYIYNAQVLCSQTNCPLLALYIFPNSPKM